MSLFRSSAWGALSLQRSLPLAPSGAPVPLAQRHALPRPRAPGLAPVRAGAGDPSTIRAIPAVLAREPVDGR